MKRKLYDRTLWEEIYGGEKTACNAGAPAKRCRPQARARGGYTLQGDTGVDGEPFDAPRNRDQEGAQSRPDRHESEALRASYSPSLEKNQQDRPDAKAKGINRTKEVEAKDAPKKFKPYNRKAISQKDSDRAVRALVTCT